MEKGRKESEIKKIFPKIHSETKRTKKIKFKNKAHCLKKIMIKTIRASCKLKIKVEKYIQIKQL
jgi:hypothetical protein